MLVGILAGVLILASAAVLIGGGFSTRQRQTWPIVPPGTLLRIGPYELAFTHITVSRSTLLDEPEWNVTAYGTGRLVDADQAQAPIVFNTFALGDPTNGMAVEGESQEVGPPRENGVGGISTFTPGLPATDYRVEFTLPYQYRPVGYLRLGVSQLTYEDHSYLGNYVDSWGTNGEGYQLYLPVTVVADN